MAARGHDRAPGQSLKSEINITPLVDVMLVVLIIFIVVTPLLQQSAKVDLPAARHLEEASEDETQALTVTLQENGRVLIGRDPVVRTDLAGLLRLRRREDPSLSFQIKADRGVAYGEIKELLRAGRAAGFRGAALLAEEAEATAEPLLETAPSPPASAPTSAAGPTPEPAPQLATEPTP